MDVIEVACRHASLAKVAKYSDKVYKDECMYCFRGPLAADGLFVNLNTFEGVCHHHLDLDQSRSGTALYLNIKQNKLADEARQTQLQQCSLQVPIVADEGPAKPEKLAIGIPGGFDVNKSKEKIEEEFYLATGCPPVSVPLPCPKLPERVLESIISIQEHEGAFVQTEAEAWEEERRVSKYAENLEQLPCDRKIPMDPKQWKCDETGATENLWLNLSTGHIGSGRPQWDGTGGTGSALRHFEATGKKYPLVVKLGTITPAGADVYSYAEDEDDMVLDPKLAEHLAHWGINILQMEKTEKTMAELQVEKNLSYEFDKITEAGADLQPISGQGYMGLKNLGNTCYMNSTLQVLWTIPELQAKYLPFAESIFRTSPANPANDFLTQFTKIGTALAGPEISDGEAYSHSPLTTVTPLAFKTLVGRGHPEFSSQRQQDAQEYFSYLIDMLGRAEHAGVGRLESSELSTKLFEYGMETRIECLTSHKVSYMKEKNTILSLEIPLEAAINTAEVADYNERVQKRQKLKDEEDAEEKVLPRVPLSACLEKFSAPEEIDGYFSAFLKANTKASKTTRFTSFPAYLMIHLRRYYVAEDWTPKKLEVLVDMPDYFSLENLRSTGPQTNEELQPEAGEPEADESLVAQLVDMGFPVEKCKRAALSTGNNDVQAAMEWLFVHGNEEEVGTAADASAESIAMLEGMGFSGEKAKAALAACNNNVERAVDWLFNHMDDDTSVVPAETQVISTEDTYHKGEYEIVGVISHIGKNTGSGHYVCHIKRDGKWVIYNDEKVAVSANPPIEMGYMYLYKRI